jgi:hypothetical protein
MKLVYNGLESAGKSLMLSRQAEKNRKQAIRWLKRRKKLGLDPNPRTLAFNQPMSDKFIHSCKDNGIGYKEFRSFSEIEDDTETDFHIDELLKFFPARGGDPLPFHVLEWITQGAKSGNNVYGCSQDFSQVHKQFRILTNKVYIVRKHIGSPRPIKSMPPVGSIWGVCSKQSVKPESFKGDMAEMQGNFIPIPFLISKADALRYDTLYRIPQASLPDRKLRPQRVYKINENHEIIEDKITYRER